MRLLTEAGAQLNIKTEVQLSQLSHDTMHAAPLHGAQLNIKTGVYKLCFCSLHHEDYIIHNL